MVYIPIRHKELIITGRDRHLPSSLEAIIQSSGLKDRFINAGEWVKDTDLAHTIASLEDVFDIAHYIGINPTLIKIVASAMIVHDCAYPKAKNYEEFKSPENRRQHMENAATEFRDFAGFINRLYWNKKEDSGYYTQEEIEQVCSIIEQHDNPGLEKDFDYTGLDERLLFIHREADRLWMLHPAGFALDLLREIIEKSKYDPAARLDYVISDHIKETGAYKKFNHLIKRYHGAPIIYRTGKGFDLFLRSLDKIERSYPKARLDMSIKRIEDCIGSYKVDYELSSETVGHIMRELEELEGRVKEFAKQLDNGEELSCFLDIYGSLYEHQPVLSYAVGPYTGRIEKFMEKVSQRIGIYTDSKEKINLMNAICSEFDSED